MKKYLLTGLFIGWGLALSGQPISPPSLVTGYEFWFNNLTEGKVTQAVTPSAVFELNVQADATHLPDGLNILTLRFSDDQGNWSSPLSRFFVKMPEQQASPEPKNIVEQEYWFNNQPPTRETVTPATLHVTDQELSASDLPDGLNTFTMRFRDDHGNWSSPLTRFFVKMPEQQASPEPKNIVEQEYWFNNQPPTRETVTPATLHVTDQELSASDLPDGLNTFTMRFRDDHGNWSSPLTRFFVKMPEQQASPEPKHIVAWEYTLNNAPAVTFPVQPTTLFVLDEQLEAASLPDGMNIVVIRFRDDHGNWSSPLTRFFVKMAPTAAGENLIKAYEYRIEDAGGQITGDNGSGAFTRVTLAGPVSPAMIQFDATFDEVPKGDYTIHFRALDTHDVWSSLLSRSIIKEALPKARFSLAAGPLCADSTLFFLNESIDADLCSWDFGDGGTSTECTPVHHFEEAGTYMVSLTVTDTLSQRQGTSTLTITVDRCVEDQILELTAGWNLISLYVTPPRTSIDELFLPLVGNNTLRKVMDEEGFTYEYLGDLGGWQNHIGHWQNSEGYKVNVNAATQMTVTGPLVPLPLTVPLATGWNIISFPVTSPGDAEEMIRPLRDAGVLVKVMDEAGNSIEDLGLLGGWINHIGDFLPGRGYKVRVSAGTSLTLQEGNLKSAMPVYRPLPSDHFRPLFRGHGTNHFNLHLVGPEASGLMEGDQLGLFDGPLCVGSATIGPLTPGLRILTLTASAHDGLQGERNGFISGNPLSLRLFRQGRELPLDIEPLTPAGQPAPVITFTAHGSALARVNLGNTTGIHALSTELLAGCYPNPFSETIHIDIRLSGKEQLKVDVIDQLGRQVKTLHDGGAAGKITLVWNARDSRGKALSPGVYLCRIMTGHQITTLKMILNR
jgi:PKD repeat protein